MKKFSILLVSVLVLLGSVQMAGATAFVTDTWSGQTYAAALDDSMNCQEFDLLATQTLGGYLVRIGSTDEKTLPPDHFDGHYSGHAKIVNRQAGFHRSLV